jgi:hypothetical protein
MSFRATGFKRKGLIFFVAAGFMAQAAFGQVKNSPIIFANEGGVTSGLVNPPIATDSDGGSPGELAQWLKVEFHYSVNPQKTPFLDAVTFKIWIEGRDLYAANAPGNQGVAVALTGTVDYVNLPKARDAFGVFYVHPSALARYSGPDGLADFDRKFNIHVEADVAGAPVDNIDKFKDPSGKLDWFTQLVPVSGVVFRQNQSPFVAVNASRYPEMKLPTASGQ